MDLLTFIGAAKQAIAALNSGRGSEPWATDEEAFHRHFGVPYEAFMEVVEHLDEDQKRLLQRTLDVNPEAAVLWILAMEETDG